jgi:Ribbon-helix-helix protein, copG family
MTWAEAIIVTMSKRLRHDWKLSEIYSAVERLPILKERHRNHWGSQPNYHHWIRSELAKLCRKGKIRRIGRSTYRLQGKGRRAHSAVISTTNKTRLTIYLDDEILKQIKKESEKTGKSSSVLINEALNARFGVANVR